MSYSKNISVSAKNSLKRTIDISLGRYDIVNSGFLSDFSLDSIEEIIEELTKVINGTLENFYWGQEQIMIESYQNSSMCYNEMEQKSLPNVSTIDLLNLMNQIKTFKEQYENPINLKSIVGQAFNTIKGNPNNFKLNPNSEYFFQITLNEILILLTLESNDFNLTETEYVNQLQTNF
jgi:hypothetical protein